MSNAIELCTCEHCNKDRNITTMTIMEGCWFCKSCTDEFQATFDACDHKWSPHTNEMGEPGQYCERCIGFVANEDFPKLFGATALVPHDGEKP